MKLGIGVLLQTNINLAEALLAICEKMFEFICKNNIINTALTIAVKLNKTHFIELDSDKKIINFSNKRKCLWKPSHYIDENKGWQEIPKLTWWQWGFNFNTKYEECVICMEELNTNITTKCNHTFCKKCMFEHLKKKNECPMCRQNILISNTSDYSISSILSDRPYSSVLPDHLYSSMMQEIGRTRRSRQHNGMTLIPAS